MTAPHSSAISAAAIASRCSTDMRRIDGEIEAGGGARPGWWGGGGGGKGVGMSARANRSRRRCYNVTSAPVQPAAGRARRRQVEVIGRISRTLRPRYDRWRLDQILGHAT